MNQAQWPVKPYTFARPRTHAMPWGSQDMVVGDPFGKRWVLIDAISA
ncbi:MULTISPECIES: hypothetical protein [unclassified Pseudomonas]|nr:MULTISPECIES: hypothetical protein [unclassified Pseudomonas]CDF97400.1 hypothetical protein BN844_3854 [Pseudomonas sp. SHC52]